MKRAQPHTHVSVTTCSLADIGHIRAQQQDSLGYLNIPTDQNTVPPQRGNLYVVADGVGGSQAGDVASRLAVETIIEHYYTAPATRVEYALKNAILRAHQRLQAKSEARTTVVCALICGSRLVVAHVGDSRAYLLRAGKLKRVTSDHSVVQEMIDKDQLSEEEAQRHPDRHLITRSLGSHSHEPTISRFQIEPGDLLLLCSDGLHGELSDESIETVLLANTNPESACAALVEQANLSGGRDNISLILTRVEAMPTLFSFHQEPHLPPLKLRDINHFSYARVAPNHNEALQPLEFNEINDLCHTTALSVDSITAQAIEANRFCWRTSSTRLLAAVTMILLSMLIMQTIWFQSHYRDLPQNKVYRSTESSLIIPIPTPTPHTNP
ncbi:MAG: PP2C family protein-serine/threonine phosphatase [Ardenticatenaceae bacterium]